MNEFDRRWWHTAARVQIMQTQIEELRKQPASQGLKHAIWKLDYAMRKESEKL